MASENINLTGEIGKVTIEKVINNPSDMTFAHRRVSDDVWDYRNRLGLQEVDETYNQQLDALYQTFKDGGAVSTATSTLLTGMSVASVAKTISAVEMKALEDFVSDVGSLGGEIFVSLPFIGVSSANRLIEHIGTVTVTGSALTWNTAGLACNGSTTLVATSANCNAAFTGSLQGGFGVYVVNCASTATQCFAGVSDTNDTFKIEYHGSSNIMQGVLGSTLVASITLTDSPRANYFHVERQGSTKLHFYKDGVLTGSNAVVSFFTSAAVPFFVGCQNINGSTQQNFTAGSIGCFLATTGKLTDAQVTTVSGAVIEMMKKFGR